MIIENTQTEPIELPHIFKSLGTQVLRPGPNDINPHYWAAVQGMSAIMAHVDAGRIKVPNPGKV